MPQVDKVTFLPVAFWTFTLYVGGFLFLSSTYLYTLVAAMKFSFKRTTQKFISAAITQHFLSATLLFPWIAL